MSSTDPRMAIRRLMREQGLVPVSAASLALQRVHCGRGFKYVDAEGKIIRTVETLRRLKALAMPPAYVNVRYAEHASAHLQAVGEDAAGRLQYRYHVHWTDVREAVKARRLAELARSLPAVSRAVRRCLDKEDHGQRWTAAAVVLLVSMTALRAGSDAYARERGTRGATTLLKTNVRVDGAHVALRFRAKGAKTVVRELRDRRLAVTIGRLLDLPGRRLFQYRSADNAIRQIRAADVNAFLREVSGRHISLKDFRTLVASLGVMRALATEERATSKRGRQAQLKRAIAEAADKLANTPTVCRKSYVHDSVVAAFEKGALSRPGVRRARKEDVEALARMVGRHDTAMVRLAPG